jgi:hypothetical protein
MEQSQGGLLNLRQAYVSVALFLCVRSFHWDCHESIIVASGMVEDDSGKPYEPAAHEEFENAFRKVALGNDLVSIRDGFRSALIYLTEYNNIIKDEKLRILIKDIDAEPHAEYRIWEKVTEAILSGRIPYVSHNAVMVLEFYIAIDVKS